MKTFGEERHFQASNFSPLGFGPRFLCLASNPLLEHWVRHWIWTRLG